MGSIKDEKIPSKQIASENTGLVDGIAWGAIVGIVVAASCKVMFAALGFGAEQLDLDGLADRWNDSQIPLLVGAIAGTVAGNAKVSKAREDYEYVNNEMLHGLETMRHNIEARQAEHHGKLVNEINQQKETSL
jgi:hypothetical protein